jgi:hypothetical protein
MAGGPSHIAPPNWFTYCGLAPAEGVLAYDLCSLDEHLDDPERWCAACVEELRRETVEEPSVQALRRQGLLDDILERYYRAAARL